MARIVQETPDVRTFRFASPDGQRLPFQHLPGQYLVLSLRIDGKKVNRTYTIASSPSRSDYCEITVKREENGLVSRHLHDTLREGDLLNVSAPAGRFTFDGTQSDRIVLIAGGVGITPLMSILRYLTDQRWKGDIHFLYCAKTPQDIIFRQELDDLQKRFPNLHLHLTLTRAEGTDWAGRKGRITGEFLRQTIPDLVGHPVYICGPASMMEPTIQMLRELGVPADQIKSEAFVAAKRAEASLASSDSPAVPTSSAPGAPSSTSPAGDHASPRLDLCAVDEIHSFDNGENSAGNGGRRRRQHQTSNAAPAFAAGARPGSWPVPSAWKSRTPWTTRTSRQTSFCSARPGPLGT